MVLDPSPPLLFDKHGNACSGVFCPFLTTTHCNTLLHALPCAKETYNFKEPTSFSPLIDTTNTATHATEYSVSFLWACGFVFIVCVLFSPCNRFEKHGHACNRVCRRCLRTLSPVRPLFPSLSHTHTHSLSLSHSLRHCNRFE